jgi:hypothetical protein
MDCGLSRNSAGYMPGRRPEAIANSPNTHRNYNLNSSMIA